MIDKDRERAMLRAVELYYFEGFTQAAISERLGCTRWTVGRLLKEANDAGIVEITVHHEMARRNELEKRLQEKFGLVAARVTPTAPTPRDNLTRIAVATADFLEDIRPRPQVLAVGFGRTIGAIARTLPQNWNRGVTVVQMCAAPHDTDDALVGASIRMIARRGGGGARLLPPGAVYPDEQSIDATSSKPEVTGCLQLARSADTLVYAAGAVDGQANILGEGTFSDEQAAQLRSEAAAIVGNHLIGPTGEVVDEEIAKRTLGLSLDEIRHSKISVMVAGGSAKWAAAKAILLGKLTNAIVVDSRTAEHILKTT